MQLRLALTLTLATLGVAKAQSGPLDRPDPKVFARAKDQERARLMMKPCAKADIGRGCYRYDGHAFREEPCSYQIDAQTRGSLPTDQCYKMETQQRYRGVWVDVFEGQRFIPEGTSPPEWPRTGLKSSEWKEKAEQARLATIWMNANRVHFDGLTRRNGARWIIEFIGRKTMYPGSYGHFGMSGQEIIVDRVISLWECPRTGICG
ncbi:hypothetical protein J2X73_002725 [Novosphingobium sp. 1748]|nr:hypothetical protein [Novosphingobium sp. 1748]